MRHIMYVAAVTLFIAWCAGFLILQVGGIIHILPVFSLVAILLGVIDDRKTMVILEKTR